MSDFRLGTWQETLDGGPSPVADGSVRLILTSPPYDNARTYEGTNEPVDFDALARFALRVLCPGGVMAMVLDGAVNNGSVSTTPQEVALAWASGVPYRIIRKMALGEALSPEDIALLAVPREPPGWRLLQVLAYGRRGAPGAYQGRFRRDHEPLIVMVKDGAPHVCEKGRIAERAVYKTGMRGTINRRDGTKETCSPYNEAARDKSNRGSIWYYGATGSGIDPSAGTGHPATFAEAFARDAVDVWSNPGDLVCDPYAGSATVGRACEDLGRRFVGAERVPKYHAIGMARLAQRGLFGAGDK